MLFLYFRTIAVTLVLIKLNLCKIVFMQKKKIKGFSIRLLRLNHYTVQMIGNYIFLIEDLFFWRHGWYFLVFLYNIVFYYFLCINVPKLLRASVLPVIEYTKLACFSVVIRYRYISEFFFFFLFSTCQYNYALAVILLFVWAYLEFGRTRPFRLFFSCVL